MAGVSLRDPPSYGPECRGALLTTVTCANTLHGQARVRPHRNLEVEIVQVPNCVVGRIK